MMDIEDRLLLVELAVFDIAEKIGMDLESIHEEIRNIQLRREQRWRYEKRLEEDEIFRRNRIALTRAIQTMPPVSVSVPAMIVPKPAPADPDRPRA